MFHKIREQEGTLQFILLHETWEESGLVVQHVFI